MLNFVAENRRIPDLSNPTIQRRTRLPLPSRIDPRPPPPEGILAECNSLFCWLLVHRFAPNNFDFGNECVLIPSCANVVWFV